MGSVLYDISLSAVRVIGDSRVFNKYEVKILAILNGTTQKEIKSRLAEVKKEVA